MAMLPVTEAVTEHRLTLSEVLDSLVSDGQVPRATADQLIAERRMHRGDHHPLVEIGRAHV